MNAIMIQSNMPNNLLKQIRSVFGFCGIKGITEIYNACLIVLKRLMKKMTLTNYLFVSFLVVLGLLYTLMRKRTEIVIYHGSYSAYTPITLQKRIQDEYDRILPIWDHRYLLRAVVEDNEKLDYMHSWFHCLAKKKNTENKVHLYSINTATWLKIGKLSGDSLTKLSKEYLYNDSIQNETLCIIGYKKQDRLYYMPLFLWHSDSSIYSVDSALKHGRQFVLNQKSGSGCSNLVPTIYLLENYGYPPMFLMGKKDIVQEVIKKKQLIGVISTDEYCSQLDDSQKENLFIEPMPINIPLDPIVVKCSEWTRLCPKERDDLKEMLIRESLMIDKKGIESEKMCCLGEMLYFYLSMPILHVSDSTSDTVNILHWGMDGFKSEFSDTTVKEVAYLCKVNYACLGSEYYSFVKDSVSFCSIRKTESYFQNKQIADKVRRGYNRVVFKEQEKRFDRLMQEYSDCFN